MPGSHSKKDKLKKRIAALDDVTSQHKKKNKDKEKLLTKQGKGVAPNYNNPSKVKKKRLKGKVSKQLIALRKKVNNLKTKPPQGPSGGTADTPDAIIKDAEAVAKTPSYIAKDHEHSIHFKGYKGQFYKRASLVSTQGKFAKYWLLNAKQTNGNGWGVSQQSIAKNIHKFVGRPLVVTAKSWVPDSVYGDVYEHPYLPTNDIGKVLDHQEKYRVGNIVDIIEKNGDYYANIEINQKFAHMILPPFCSPAIFQNNPSEAEGQISDWEALHLAALHEDPAYGSRIALLRGTCVGTHDQCTIQFKSAKKEAKMVCTKGLKERLAGLFPKEKRHWEEQGYKEKPSWYGDTCPGCGQEIQEFPSLSREDNETHICTDCGNKEALGEYVNVKGKTELQGNEENKSKKLRKSKPGGFYTDRFGGGGKLGGLKKNENLKQRIAGIQRTAADEWTDIEDKDFFRKPLNLRPPEYSKEYGMNKMDYIGNLHNESAWNAGQKAMERFDKELSHPFSKRYAYDLMDEHAYDKYLNLVNTDLQDAVEYNDSNSILQTLDKFDSDNTDGLDYKIKDKFGFGDPPPKPKSKGESIGRALVEPFEKMKDEEYSQITDRKGDMLRTKKILGDFNKDTSGGMMKLFGRNKNNLQAKLKQRLADVAPERVLSSEADSNIAGYEAQDLLGEKTELQKRTLNRGLKPKPRSKSKKPSDFKTSEERINYLKEQRVLSKQQTDDDFERMRSQYISEDNIKKNKWAKLKQRLATLNIPKGGDTGMEKITADYNKHKPAIKKLGTQTGYTIHDGELLDFTNQEHVNKFASAYPGKKGEHLYMVANTKGIHNINNKMLDTKNKDWANQGFASVQGGWRGEHDKRHQIDLNAVFRSKDSKKALELAKKYDQEAITEIDSVANTVRYPENPFWSGRKQ